MTSPAIASPAGREALLAAAHAARETAYAPYSGFRVGAALAFADGTVVVGANVENASYGLSLCAEAVAVASALSAGRRGGLLALAVVGGSGVGQPDSSTRGTGAPVTPCGRCRQMLHELAALDGADPLIWTEGREAPLRLSDLLPHPFGPAELHR
jgi:cytidine deaminase